MTHDPDLALRTGFDQAAERYDRARHGYPDALFDELFALLPPRPAVVEVGPGTGQATRSLLARGARVTAVELGQAMARRLRANLGGPDLDVLVSSFEQARLPAASYDAVVAATAYHWVPAGAQLTLPARLLRPGGWLAVIDTIQVDEPTDGGFWDRIQEVFDRHGAGHRPGTPPPQTFAAATPPLLPALADSALADSALAESALYEDVQVRRHRFDQTYTTAQYTDLHRTYSNWLAMPRAAGEALLADVGAVIDAEYGGSIVRPLAITLLLGRRTATPLPPQPPTAPPATG